MKQPISLLSQNQKRKVIDDIIAFFLDERGEEIGIIAAEDLLDALIDDLCKPIYSKAISDVMKLIEEKYSDLHVDIDALNEYE